MPISLYESLPPHVRPPLKLSYITIKAGNDDIKLFGVALVKFEFQGMKFEYKMHIVEDTVQPILGYDFLKTLVILKFNCQPIPCLYEVRS